MKREDLRKVEFQHTMDGGYSYQTYNGYFHTWGLESVNTVTDSGQDYSTSYSIAIIEEEDGSVSTVAPQFIKFV